MSKQYKSGQHVYRIPPCPAYDIAGMEKWLSDLAEEGLFLLKDGILAGVATFEYHEPQNVKYRLEAAQKNTSMWSDNGGDPDPEQIEISEKYSWEYVAKRRGFYIYRNFDPSARELNTDPEVQVLALSTVKRRQRDALLSSFFFFFIYPIILTRGCFLLTTISMGTWWMVLVALFAALMIFDNIRAFIHLREIQKSLLNDGYYASENDWRKNTAPYFVQKSVKAGLAVFLICAFIQNWGLSITNENKIPIEEYNGTIPFATIQEFAGEGSSDYSLTMMGLSMGINTIEDRSDWVAPRCIEYNEHAMVKTADGQIIDGGLYIKYCKMRSPRLAKLMANEFYRMDRFEKNFKQAATPKLQADYVIAYYNNLHFPTVIIRKDNIVVRAMFYQTSASYKMPIEEWAQIICNSMAE